MIRSLGSGRLYRYGAPASWQWGSKAEVAAIMGGEEAACEPEKR